MRAIPSSCSPRRPPRPRPPAPCLHRMPWGCRRLRHAARRADSRGDRRGDANLRRRGRKATVIGPHRPRLHPRGSAGDRHMVRLPMGSAMTRDAMDRRDFLAASGAGAAAAAAAVPRPVRAATMARVVGGGGFGGATAARFLAEAGHHVTPWSRPRLPTPPARSATRSSAASAAWRRCDPRSTVLPHAASRSSGTERKASTATPAG
jgi:hypothetical protein